MVFVAQPGPQMPDADGFEIPPRARGQSTGQPDRVAVSRRQMA